MRFPIALAVLLAALPAIAQHEHHANPAPEPAATAQTFDIPDVEVLDQTGAKRSFYTDLVKDRVVVVNFVFTSCTTVCPTMGATFARVQQLLGDREVSLISVSVDPVVDTPERLAAWSKRLGAAPGWTLVTGEKPQIDLLLKRLGVFTPNRESHTPTVLVGNARNGQWQRANGLATPATIVSLVDTLAPPQSAAKSPAAQYFGDVVLTDHHGKRVRLYEDLMKDHTVVINSFFATCKGSCPIMARAYLALQERFKDRLGRELVLVSITVDPANDTPPKLLEFARQMKADANWHLLTGSQEDVANALRRIGQSADEREAHKNMMVIGNDRTGLWKKAFALAPAEEIAAVVASVLDDRAPQTQ